MSMKESILKRLAALEAIEVYDRYTFIDSTGQTRTMTVNELISWVFEQRGAYDPIPKSENCPISFFDKSQLDGKKQMLLISFLLKWIGYSDYK